jgi:hypothetical protein
MNKSLFAVLPLLAASLLSSCSKEPVSPDASAVTAKQAADVRLVNGRVQFATPQAFERERTQLRKMQDAAGLDSWENNLNFTSLRRHTLSDEQGAAAGLQQHFLFPVFYATIINEVGEFQIGDNIYWYHDGFRYQAANEQELAAIKANPAQAQAKTPAGGVFITPKGLSTTPNPGGATERVQDSGDSVDKKYTYSTTAGLISYGTVVYTESSIFVGSTFDSYLYLNIDIAAGRRGGNASVSRVIDYSLDLHAIAGYEHSWWYDDHNTELNNHIEQHAVAANGLLQVQLGYASCWFNNNGGRSYTNNGVKWDYQLYGYINTNVTGITPNVSFYAPASGNLLW